MKSWSDIPTPADWFDYLRSYDEAVARMPDGAVMIELGSWLGRSTAYLGQRIKEANRGIRGYCIDRCIGPYG